MNYKDAQNRLDSEQTSEPTQNRVESELKIDAAHNLSSILTELMANHPIDDATLAKYTALPPSTISRLRNNPGANPTAASLRPLARFFGISISQLLGDDLSVAGATAAGKSPQAAFGVMPLSQPTILWDQLVASIIENKPSQLTGHFKVSMNVDSYQPHFRAGSQLIVDRSLAPADGDYVIIHLLTDHAVEIKQLMVDGRDIYLRSVNPDFTKVNSLEQPHQFCGVITESRYRYRKGM